MERNDNNDFRSNDDQIGIRQSMIRKIISAFLIVVFLSTISVGIPLLLIFLNSYFNLPVYTNLYFKIIGGIFFLIGFSVVIYSTILHIKTGRETPLPIIEKPKQFIAKGFYEYCRNPMYLAETFILLGLFFIFGHILLLFYPLGFFWVVNLLVLYIEEPEMRKKFGEQYVKYTKRVPRWIPRF